MAVGSHGNVVAAALQCGIEMGYNSVRTVDIAADTESGPVPGADLAAADSCTPPRKSVAGTYTPAVVLSASSNRPTAAAAHSGDAYFLLRACQEPRALQQVPVGWQAKETKRGKRERQRRRKAYRRR